VSSKIDKYAGNVEHARGRRILAALVIALMSGAIVAATATAIVSTTNRVSRASTRSLSGQIAKCRKKFPGTTKGQRKAKHRCIEKAKETSQEGGHHGHKNPGGSTGSNPPSIPTPTPTPSPTPSPTIPDTAIDSAPPGLIARRDIRFSFHSDPSGDSFQCSLNGAAWSACASPKTYSSLADGSYEFAVRALDGESVDPTPATASLKVEATPPQTTITSSPSGRIPIGTVSVDFSSNQVDASFECSLDGQSFSSCASPYELPSPSPGPHDLEVRAVNAAGVADPSPDSAAWSSVEARHDLCGSIGHDTTIGPDYAAVYVLTCHVAVEEGVTLSVEPGAIVKGGPFNDSCDPPFGIHCALFVAGILHAVGTPAEPITFTSINDNSIGGSTGSGSPQAGDWEGIASYGGEATIDLEHARVDYATTGVWAYGEGTTVVKDDAFASQSESAAVIADSASAPTLEDNSSNGSGAGHAAYSVESSVLDADLLGANSASGDGIPVVQIAGSLGKSSTLAAQPASWEVGREPGSGPLSVPAGKTLTVAPGAIVKGGPFNDSCDPPFGIHCALFVAGTLHAVGTPAEPITFTSINDNSIGGSTGSGSPQAGDWEGIASYGGEATIDLEHARVDYATTGVWAYGEGGAAVRGELTHNSSDIRTCDWNSNCSVDAAYVDWGVEEGPASPELVCGAVAISPYLHDGSTHETGSIPKNCDGSPNPWEALDTGQQSFNEGVAQTESTCAELGDDVCEVISSAFSCLSGAFDLGASQLPFALPNPFSGGASGSEWQSAASTLGSAGAKWLSDSADPVVADIGEVASRGFQIVGLAGTFSTMASAYSQCAP
jgi:hypothetical protein